VGSYGDGSRQFGAKFMGARTSSFADFLTSYAPELLPGQQPVEARQTGGDAPVSGPHPSGQPALEFEHGTTIVAAKFADGVVLAGDRRATMGSMISKRDVEKVFRSDEFSAMGVAGVWSAAVDMVRLFQVELEHYEKMEGRPLSLAGKANRLATLIRGNLGAAMQGLVVVPLFVGYDEDEETGRIFSYDVAGGPSEERNFYSIGSGSIFARGSLKKLYTRGMARREAILACVQALYDAADDDSGTGGPDLARQLFPIIATVTADGFSRVTPEDAAEFARTVVEGRMTAPDGPTAPLD
jgi:proteasome beta subunit